MNRSALITHQVLRSFGASQVRFGSNTARQSHMLNKLLHGKKKAQYKWNDVAGPTKPKGLLETKGTSKKITSRRVVVLNKLFMRHVTDLIGAGSIGEDLKGLGLVITKVLVCQNYHGLNVFWTTNISTNYDEVQQKLDSINKRLRHELSQMQLMGNIPHITFVKDAQVGYANELDYLLATADYGDDYEPSESKSGIDDDFDPENVQSDALKQINSSLPAMRHDVFGLNHAVIMGRIKQSMAKSKQAWKAYEDGSQQFESSKPYSLTTSFESIRKGAEDEKRSTDILQEFLLKRKLQRKLQRKADSDMSAKLNESFIDNEGDGFDDGDANEVTQWQDDEIYDTYDGSENSDDRF